MLVMRLLLILPTSSTLIPNLSSSSHVMGISSSTRDSSDRLSYTTTLITMPPWLILWVLMSRYRSNTDFMDYLWVMMYRQLFLVFIRNWYSYSYLFMGSLVRHSSYWVLLLSMLISSSCHLLGLGAYLLMNGLVRSPSMAAWSMIVSTISLIWHTKSPAFWGFWLLHSSMYTRLLGPIITLLNAHPFPINFTHCSILLIDSIFSSSTLLITTRFYDSCSPTSPLNGICF